MAPRFERELRRATAPTGKLVYEIGRKRKSSLFRGNVEAALNGYYSSPEKYGGATISSARSRVPADYDNFER
jgi:hypothetical protein